MSSIPCHWNTEDLLTQGKIIVTHVLIRYTLVNLEKPSLSYRLNSSGHSQAQRAISGQEWQKPSNRPEFGMREDAVGEWVNSL